MSDPTLYGFLKDVAPWMGTLLGVALGYSKKGGANQVKLDAVCAAQAETAKTVGNNTSTLATHQEMLNANVKGMDEMRSELRENNRLLGMLLGESKIKDSQTFRTLR